MKLLTIDPGASGGWCLRWSDHIEAHPWISANDACAALREHFKAGNLTVVVEAVHSSPVMSPSSSFSFGHNYGTWLGIIVSMTGRTPLGVSPQQWQMPLADELFGLTGSKRKSALNDMCKANHPKLRPTLATCDAILLSDFCVSYQSTVGHFPGKFL